MLKRIELMVVLMLSVFLFASLASAGCTYSTVRKFELYQGFDRPITLVYHCIADGSNAVNDLTITGMTGFLQHMAVVPTTGKEPTSVTPNLKTIDGTPAYTASAIASPWPRQDMEPPLGFSSGLVVDQSATCDATDEWDLLMTFL